MVAYRAGSRILRRRLATLGCSHGRFIRALGNVPASRVYAARHLGRQFGLAHVGLSELFDPRRQSQSMVGGHAGVR